MRKPSQILFFDISSKRAGIKRKRLDDKNGDLTPDMVSLKSHQKAWWRCDKGHEWQAAISSRSSGIGCPYCSNKKVLIGYNDLKTLYPTLSSEWNYDKNGELKPDMFTPGAAKKVWWKCEKGHEWEATINHRTARNSRCPYCIGARVIKGETDLQTLFPEIASQWNYDKNKNISPDMFKPGSNKKVWWICEKGHEWQVSIADRAIGGHKCPICSNQKVLPGYNDLQTTNPQLLLEWDYDKNCDLKPDMFTQGSGKIVWWKCSICGHEWKAAIRERKRFGCPNWRKHNK